MIKHILVPAKGAPNGWVCERCKKTLKPGEKALMIRRPNANFALHDMCVVSLVIADPKLPNRDAKQRLLAKEAREKAQEAKIKAEFEELKRQYDPTKDANGI